MTVPDINYLAVVLAVVASMAVGFVYYHPKVLGTRWMAAVGHTGDSIQKGSPLVYPMVAVASFVTAWVLAGCTFISQNFYGSGFLLNALITAWILWGGFTAARFLVHDAFDVRGFTVWWINTLNEFLIVTAMALVIGLLPPS